MHRINAQVSSGLHHLGRAGGGVGLGEEGGEQRDLTAPLAFPPPLFQTRIAEAWQVSLITQYSPDFWIDKIPLGESKIQDWVPERERDENIIKKKVKIKIHMQDHW